MTNRPHAIVEFTNTYEDPHVWTYPDALTARRTYTDKLLPSLRQDIRDTFGEGALDAEALRRDKLLDDLAEWGDLASRRPELQTERAWQRVAHHLTELQRYAQEDASYERWLFVVPIENVEMEVTS